MKFDIKEQKWLLGEWGWKIFKRKDNGELVCLDPRRKEVIISVTHLSINGSILPGLDDLFDINEAYIT